MDEDKRKQWDEIVRINHDVPAIQEVAAELSRLRAIEQRAGDVDLIRAFIRSERCPGEIDDPFHSYQEGKISKGKLCEIIAKSLSKWLLGKEGGDPNRTGR